MRSRTDNTRSTVSRPEPPPRRTRAGRSVTAAARRRAAAEPAAPNVPPPSAGPISLYRAEKARRASSVDATIMAEAKRAYDELVAEQGMKRAGMRQSVVNVARRGRKPAAPKG